MCIQVFCCIRVFLPLNINIVDQKITQGCYIRHNRKIFIFYVFLLLNIGLLRRCYQCRSRGNLGNCKDSFTYNATQLDNVRGVTAVPCASGWCGKVIEGGRSLRDDGKCESNSI